MQYFVKGAWRDMYWFALAPVTNTVLQACSDFSFKQHPLFTKHMIVSRVVPDGRVQLYDMVLTTRRAGQPAEEQHLQSEQERDAVLQDVFGLDLSLPAVPL
jgi:arylamine N-acetyltransferase